MGPRPPPERRTPSGWNEELALVSEVAGRLADREELRPEPFPDVAAFFARLRLEGLVLDGGELGGRAGPPGGGAALLRAAWTGPRAPRRASSR